MSALGVGKRHDMEVRRYPILIYALVPLAALVFQAWLPRVMGRYVWFDLPLIVTIYFALSRRSPIQGMLTGATLGILQDALTHNAIGINGIAKTIAGFIGASIGFHLDVDNQTIRLLLNFLLSLLCSAVFVFINRVLLGLTLDWSWLTELFRALGNCLIVAFLYPVLDRAEMPE